MPFSAFVAFHMKMPWNRQEGQSSTVASSHGKFPLLNESTRRHRIQLHQTSTSNNDLCSPSLLPQLSHVFYHFNSALYAINTLAFFVTLKTLQADKRASRCVSSKKNIKLPGIEKGLFHILPGNGYAFLGCTPLCVNLLLALILLPASRTETVTDLLDFSKTEQAYLVPVQANYESSEVKNLERWSF